MIDGSDPSIAGTALSAAQLIAQTKAASLVAERAAHLDQTQRASAEAHWDAYVMNKARQMQIRPTLIIPTLALQMAVDTPITR